MILGREIGEIEFSVSGSIRLDAVDKHESVRGFSPADANLREVADAATAADRNARQAS